MAYLSRWLEMESISFCDLTTSRIEEFFCIRRLEGRSDLRTPRSLEQLIAYLGKLGLSLAIRLVVAYSGNLETIGRER